MDRDGRFTAGPTDAIRVEIDFMNGRELRALESDPPQPGLAELVGTSAAFGFRRKLVEAVPDLAATRSRLHLLLDDVPVATLISGHSVGHQVPGLRSGGMSSFVGGSNYCAGFADDATMMTTYRAEGYIPAPTGPPALDLIEMSRVAEWHAMEPIPVHGMRRLRRLDVHHGADGDSVKIDAMFRDSYRREDGVETVIHEYQLNAVVNRRTSEVVLIEAIPRVLPWVECPVAALSAHRLVGLKLADINSTVREQLQGTSTCTHLNDLLRSLGDVEALLN
jgi:hypothetical protein